MIKHVTSEIEPYHTQLQSTALENEQLFLTLSFV